MAVARTTPPTPVLGERRGAPEAGRLSWRKVRLAYYALYFSCLLGANAVLLLPARAYGQTGNNATYIASWILLDAIAIIIFLFRFKHLRRGWGVSVFVGTVTALSALWSVDTTSTLTYGFLLICNLLVAQLVIGDLDTRGIIRLLAITLTATTLVGLALYHVGFIGSYYYDVFSRPNILGGQPFRGLFVHKITAGLYAALGCATAISALRGITRIAAVGIFMYAILLTSSATAIILLGTSLILYSIAHRAIRMNVGKIPFFVLVTVVTTVAIAVATFDWSNILKSLGRDETLTGRTLLWDYGLGVVSERPLLGWGYAGFFNSPFADQISATIPRFRTYDVPHFHQTYIQTAVDLGLLVLVPLAFFLLQAVYRAYSHALSTDPSTGVAMFSILGTLIVASFAVFVFVNYNFAGTFLIFLFISLLRGNHDSERRRAASAATEQLAARMAHRGQLAKAKALANQQPSNPLRHG